MTAHFGSAAATAAYSLISCGRLLSCGRAWVDPESRLPTYSVFLLASRVHHRPSAELDNYLIDRPLADNESYLTPVACTYPMGSGWSSYVAQSTMVASCLDTGFWEECFLSDERLLLPTSSQVLAVATDGVNVFGAMSHSEKVNSVGAPLDQLDAQWGSMCLEGQGDNALNQ